MQITKRAQDLPWLGALLVSLPVLAFILLVIRNTVNLPILDDYNAVLRFTEIFAGLHGWTAKAGYILTAQHNEYKLVFQHLIYAIEFESTGHLNFIFLQQLGNLFILLTAVCLWLLFPKDLYSPTQRIWLCLPVSLLVFAPTYQEALDFAMQGLQNIAIMPFALATILLLHRGRFPLACTALVLCISTSGNGFFVSVAGGLLLLQQQRRLRLLIWTLLTIACAAIYAINYQRTHIGNVISPMKSLRNVALFPFIFLGSLAERVIAATLIGIVLAVLFILLTRAGWRNANPPAFYTAVFILITALAVAGTRHTFPLIAASSSRYRLYSLIFIVLVYYALLQRLLPAQWALSRRTWAIFTALCFVFCLRSFRTANLVLRGRNQLLIQHMEEWLASPSVSAIPDEDAIFHAPPWNATLQDANRVLRQSVDDGIYRPPYTAQMPHPALTPQAPAPVPQP